MKYFIENKTGNISAYDSVEQVNLIKAVDLSLYTELTSLPKPDEVWDSATNSFVPKVYTLAEKVKQVQDKRAALYPPMADYLDAVVKGDTVAQQAYIDACLAVKAKYPKPL